MTNPERIWLPVVKPLEWVFVHARKSEADDYTILTEDHGLALYRHDGHLSQHKTEASAKAAAQADYEQRIRSALVSAPHPDMERELAEARAALRIANERFAQIDCAGWGGQTIQTKDDCFDYMKALASRGAVEVNAALSGASIPAPDKLPPHMKFRRDAMLLAMTMDGGDFAGDLDPVDGNTVEGLARTLAIVAAAYDWTVDNDGSLAGLVGGDQGFASTRIVCKDAVSAPDKAEARREALIEHLRSEFSDSYDCTRVWEAWYYNTMTEDDFEPIIDRLGEIADGMLALIYTPARRETLEELLVTAPEPAAKA